MAAHRIRASANSNASLPRCRSEGTLIDLGEGVSESTLVDVKVPSPSALRLDTSASLGTAREVVAIKDYCPSSFTTLKFSKGDRLYVLDASGGEWLYAHNNTEMGYIPAAYVQPVGLRDSSFGDAVEETASEMDLLGEWLPTPAPFRNGNPFTSTNPFLRGVPQSPPDQNGERNSTDLLLFDAPSESCTADSDGFAGAFNPAGAGLRRDNPFFRSKRSYSLSDMSLLQARSDDPAGFFGGLKAPAPEQFQSREDFRTAWLNHRKLARSCHDLDSLGQNPGWGQTQPVETNVVCRLDGSGGAVRLPDTDIVVHVPEGHVTEGDTQQISIKALLDPPLELNNDRCTTSGPVVELKLSNMETKTGITVEMKVSVEVRAEKRESTRILCVRSDCKEGPYAPVSQTHLYGDTVRVSLDNLEPCMYICVTAQSPSASPDSTVWDHVAKKITLGVYGPKHVHPSFKTVVAVFGHDCAPKSLLVNEAGKQGRASPPVALQLWGRHQFVLDRPRDLLLGMYSNMANYEVKATERAKAVRGFQLKLGKVSRLVYLISSRDGAEVSDFTLRIQIKDEQGAMLAQFCVQTPAPPPKTGPKTSAQRRFLKKKEVGKIVLSPLAVAAKYPVFRDCKITDLRFGKLIKTVVRQTKNSYLLEYKKGDFVALLSEEKVKLKGQLWTKEWYVGYYQGRVGLVHSKNVLLTGKVKPVYFSGPELTASSLLEQVLRPCKFLTYIYASVRTVLMENIGDWRAFADALGYRNLPVTHFCRTQLDSEPERVACVLEKLKEDCNNADSKERKSFQKELLTALLKLDCQGLVARLLMDFVLLTTAVEVAGRWRELAERLAKVSRRQMDAYEAPHRDKNGALDGEAMWKPAYDFLVTWASQMGDSYRDVIQDLHVGLDRMKSPVTRRWKHLSGALLLVHCLDALRGAAFAHGRQPDG
ncbi:SH3 domain-binding protein 4-like isoform X2 [Corythoichthys intestinalis]|uniref:SH3 domain-binding protein 4-like isoform X2 n=1 Tax=Corythoichthys intestinalis TaxID=161448 RepID=UPI0025A4E508|nr:SH3 domain-binding protein 4-like isoform X2 [Corythoichthys intestinalis]XP_061799810.1 SH3 domain-binding protein 4-like [Nerophis lumbriciformis]